MEENFGVLKAEKNKLDNELELQKNKFADELLSGIYGDLLQKPILIRKEKSLLGKLLNFFRRLYHR